MQLDLFLEITQLLQLVLNMLSSPRRMVAVRLGMSNPVIRCGHTARSLIVKQTLSSFQQCSCFELHKPFGLCLDGSLS